MSMTVDLVDIGDGFSATWPEHRLIILMEYLQKQAQGLIGEVTIRKGDLTLCESLRMNLNTEAKTHSIAKKISERNDELTLSEWQNVVESTTVRVLRRYREGEPLRTLTADTPVESLFYSVNPFVFHGKCSVLYGDGGLGKSSLALLIAMLVSTGQTVAGMAALPGVPLFLDYEDDHSVLVRRMSAIVSAHPNLTGAQVRYQACTEPLAGLVHTMMRRIQTEGISFLVLDSLAAATGGDASAEAAARLFRAIRTFNLSTLVIAHVSKGQNEGQDSSIYGSVFNKNFSRATWEVKKEQEVGADTSVLGLFNRKSNLSRLHHAFGLKVTQNELNTLIHYESADLNQAQELAGWLPLAHQIRNLLEDGEPRSSKEIADELGAKWPSVKVTLSKHKGTKWQMVGQSKDPKWCVLHD